MTCSSFTFLSRVAQSAVMGLSNGSALLGAKLYSSNSVKSARIMSRYASHMPALRASSGSVRLPHAGPAGEQPLAVLRSKSGF